MSKQLTWRELSALEDGTRVRFVAAWDIFPITVVDAGTLGTNELNEITTQAMVLPDSRELRRALAEWDGEVYLGPFLGGGVSHDEDEEWDALSPLAVEG